MSQNREAKPHGGLRAGQEGGAASAAAKNSEVASRASRTCNYHAMGEAKEEG